MILYVDTANSHQLILPPRSHTLSGKGVWLLLLYIDSIIEQLAYNGWVKMDRFINT
jgi:hypothetical protein